MTPQEVKMSISGLLDVLNTGIVLSDDNNQYVIKPDI